MQKLFSANKGTTILPVLLDGTKQNGQGGLFTTASLDKKSGEVVLKVVNITSAAKDASVKIAGRQGKQSGAGFVLASTDLKGENSLDQPTKLAPVEQKLTFPANEFSYTFAPNSVTVLRLAGN